MALACLAKCGGVISDTLDGGDASDDLGVTAGDAAPADASSDGAVHSNLKLTSISSSQWHVCAVTSASSVVCWGNNQNGQLGNGTTKENLDPVTALPSGMVAVAAGYFHSCALTTSGSAWCWGLGGTLGNGGSGSDSPSAVSVVGLTKAHALAAGDGHTCAITDTGVMCWGSNYHGELGNGSTTDALLPVAVSGLGSGVVAIAAGAAHTCAANATGDVLCWGWNKWGQLGDGTTSDRLVPVTVSGVSNVVALAAGELHTCALTADGADFCWGANGGGQVGDGTQSSVPVSVPVTVSGLSSGVASIAAGLDFTCAVTSVGAAFCWGDNYARQLGDNSDAEYRLVPSPVFGLSSGVVAIAGGDAHACAITTAGGGLCWGSLALGNASTTYSPVPIGVTGFP